MFCFDYAKAFTIEIRKPDCMGDETTRDLEQIKLVLNARLEEYKALRAEIVATLTSAYNTTTLTLTGAGALIAGSPFILQYQKPVLFLVASLVFYSIALTQLRYQQAVFNMSNHIIKVVAPAIRRDLKDVATSTIGGDYLDDVLSWESAGRSKNHSDEKKFYPVEFARYLIPLLAGIISALSYLFVTIQKGTFDKWDVFMFCISLAVFAYSNYITYEVRQYLRGEKSPDDESEAESKIVHGT